MKLKTFPIMISKHFMRDHPRAGEDTQFREKIELAVAGKRKIVVSTWLDKNKLTRTRAELSEETGKIHTIRDNYEYWARIASEVNAGRGVLSLRQWTGSPYNYQRDGSKPKEFLQLTKMGVQRFGYEHHQPAAFIDGGCKKELEFHFSQRIQIIATNDGLSLDDWHGWFQKDMSDAAIIHFTDFRYGA